MTERTEAIKQEHHLFSDLGPGGNEKTYERFVVEAGKYETSPKDDGVVESYKYSEEFLSFAESLRALQACIGYPWRRIVFFDAEKGIDVTDFNGIEFKVLYRKDLETGFFKRVED